VKGMRSVVGFCSLDVVVGDGVVLQYYTYIHQSGAQNPHLPSMAGVGGVWRVS